MTKDITIAQSTPDRPIEPNNLGLVKTDPYFILKATGIVLVIVKLWVFVECWVFLFPGTIVHAIDCDGHDCSVVTVKVFMPLNLLCFQGPNLLGPVPQLLTLEIAQANIEPTLDKIDILWVRPKIEMGYQVSLKSLSDFSFSLRRASSIEV